MITQAQFDSLANYNLAGDNESPVVSIYVPTYRVGREQEDHIRFKNAVKKAHGKLQKWGDLSENEADAYLKPLDLLLNDDSFWQNQSDGLAVFLNADGDLSYYTCPVDFEPFVYVSNIFYLRPLIPVVSNDSKFYILSLSRGAIKFFQATQYSITPIDINGMVPANMDAALLKDDPESNLGRAGAPVTNRGSNGPNATTFGRGADLDHENEDLKAYFDRVDRGINDYLCDAKEPLVLAGVDELVPIYQAANGYAHLHTEGHASGNFDNESAGMIHEQAWAAVAGHFDTQRKRDLELFGTNLAADEASFTTFGIVPAAINGRVAVLWTVKDAYEYGVYKPKTNGVEVRTDTDRDGTELYNLAAVRAYQAGARVYNVPREELPRPVAGMCAIYRYAVDAQTTNLDASEPAAV